MKNKNGINPQDIWIKISKMKEIAQLVLNNDIEGLATAPAREGSSMAERIKSVIGPWQETIGDPWSRRKAKHEEAPERNGEESEREWRTWIQAGRGERLPIDQAPRLAGLQQQNPIPQMGQKTQRIH